jgi:hypothetical protein
MTNFPVNIPHLGIFFNWKCKKMPFFSNAKGFIESSVVRGSISSLTAAGA